MQLSHRRLELVADLGQRVGDTRGRTRVNNALHQALRFELTQAP